MKSFYMTKRSIFQWVTNIHFIVPEKIKLINLVYIFKIKSLVFSIYNVEKKEKIYKLAATYKSQKNILRLTPSA